MLPNFFVIGAYKSGTTSLNEYLSQHPQIFMPRIKEPNYFALPGAGADADKMVFRRSVKSRAEYEALYADAKHYVAVGDVSPEYMTSPFAAQAIWESVPHSKLIAILRNPVERAYSDFLMYRRDGKEKEIDFAKALDNQAHRASKLDPTGFYISTGFYGQQLARYYKLFPAEQIMVIPLDQLESDGPRTLSRIFEFLGVDPTFVPESLAVYNRSGVASSYLVTRLFQYKHVVGPFARRLVPHELRTRVRHWLEDRLMKPPLQLAVRRSLNEVFKEDIRLLEKLTGQSFRNWLQ